MTTPLSALQECAREQRFRASLDLLRSAMREQFLDRDNTTKFISRPTRITIGGIEEYFDFDFELGLFCIGAKLAFVQDGYDLVFDKNPIR